MNENAVRPAAHGDVPGIVNCYLRSWKAAYTPDLHSSLLEQEAQKRQTFDWRRAIDSDAANVFVLADSERILGVVQAELNLPSPRDLPEITMLYIDPDAWGTGVAARLLNAGVEWIRNTGASSARLRVVEVHRRARHFYEREGWEVDNQLAPASNDFFRLIYYRRQLAV